MEQEWVRHDRRFTSCIKSQPSEVRRQVVLHGHGPVPGEIPVILDTDPILPPTRGKKYKGVVQGIPTV